MKISNLIIVVVAIITMSCGGAKHNTSAKDSVQSIKDKEVITFTDISPLLDQKCSSCHKAGSSLFNILDYEEALSWIEEINNSVVVFKNMPSSGSMSELEREIIARWVSDGGLEGEPTDENSPEEDEPGDEDNPEEDNPEENLISFSEDILPLFEMKCSLCHNSTSGLLNVTDYTAVIAKLDAIRNRVVVIKDMPQVGSMTTEERDLVDKWVEQGAAE